MAATNTTSCLLIMTEAGPGMLNILHQHSAELSCLKYQDKHYPELLSCMNWLLLGTEQHQPCTHGINDEAVTCFQFMWLWGTGLVSIWRVS